MSAERLCGQWAGCPGAMWMNLTELHPRGIWRAPMDRPSQTVLCATYSEGRSVVSSSLRPLGLYSLWNSPGHNTGVGSLSLHQGIFPTQGLNPGLLHCRQILYQLSHQGIRGIQEGRGREARPEHSDSATTKHLLFNSQGLLHGLLT